MQGVIGQVHFLNPRDIVLKGIFFNQPAGAVNALKFMPQSITWQFLVFLHHFLNIRGCLLDQPPDIFLDDHRV